MQQITIAGRIGKDAEVREVNGSEVCNFSVATDQGFGDRKETNWWRIAFWGKRGAALAPYLLKGGDVTVAGEFLFGNYDGKPQLEIRANDVKLQGGKRESQSGNRGGGSSGYQADQDDLDDHVPFGSSDWHHDLLRRRVPD